MLDCSLAIKANVKHKICLYACVFTGFFDKNYILGDLSLSDEGDLMWEN